MMTAVLVFGAKVSVWCVQQVICGGRADAGCAECNQHIYGIVWQEYKYNLVGKKGMWC